MMPDNLEEITLGREALDYIGESLRDGEELSLRLLKSVRLEAGSVVTYLPKGTAISSIRNFQSGGILGPMTPVTVGTGDEHHSQSRISTIPTADSALASLITGHLIAMPTSLCLFENRLAKPKDSWLRHSRMHNLTLGMTVCHYLSSQDSRDTELIRLTIKKSRSISPPLLGVLTQLGDGAVMGLVDDANGDVLKGIVDRTEKLIVGAYDGEGFIVWRLTR